MNKSNIAIKLDQVSKHYTQKRNRLTNSDHAVLENVSFTIRRGEKIGIYGTNGAGKTTLLKIIAGVTHPSNGQVEVFGKIATIMDLESGFHPDMTGRDNVLVNAVLWGMTLNQAKSKLSSIKDFSGIKESFENKFFTYSSGMKFRLAFATAIASDCDIIILDEVFASGDLNFQAKVASYLSRIQTDKKITTIMCSHVPAMIWKFASTYYHIHSSRVKKIPRTQLEISINKEAKKWKDIYAINRDIL